MAEHREKVEVEREYHTCDVCGTRSLKCQLSFCQICHKEVCMSCRCGDDDGEYDKYCPDCFKVRAAFIEEYNRLAKEYYEARTLVMDRWKAAAKESQEKDNGLLS